MRLGAEPLAHLARDLRASAARRSARVIMRSVSRTRSSGTIARNGDWLSCTASASRSVRSKTGSPVWFTNSASRTWSRSLSAPAGPRPRSSSTALASTASRDEAQGQPAPPSAAQAARMRRRDELAISCVGDEAPSVWRWIRRSSAASSAARLVARRRVLLQQPPDQGLELGRQVGSELGRGPGRAVQHGVEDRGGGRAREGALPGRHLVEHRAEREQVGALVERLAEGLLGRHRRPASRRRRVSVGTEGVVSTVEAAGAASGREPSRSSCGEAEVEHLGVAPVGGHEDVGRLQVAVDHALRVRGLERLGDRRSPSVEQPLARRAAPPRALAQRAGPRAAPSR